MQNAQLPEQQAPVRSPDPAGNSVKTVGSLAYSKEENWTSKYWRIKCEPHVAIKLKRLFPRIPTNKFSEYHLKDTPETCRDLEWFMSRYPFEVSAQDRDRLTAGARGHEERLLRVADLMAGVQLSSDFETAIPLRSYQKVVPEIVLTQGFLLLADDLGLGKTAAGIGLLTRGLARPALVVTATALTLQWQRELARFAPSLTSHILTKGSVYDLTTHGKKRHPRQTTIISQMPDVVICNYAKLAGWAEHLSQIMTTVIYDEAQELRRSDSQSTRQRVASPRSADTE